MEQASFGTKLFIRRFGLRNLHFLLLFSVSSTRSSRPLMTVFAQLPAAATATAESFELIILTKDGERD